MSNNYVTRTELMDFMNGVDQTFREMLAKHRLELAQRDERIAELEQRFSKLSAQFDGLICELEHQGDPEGF